MSSTSLYNGKIGREINHTTARVRTCANLVTRPPIDLSRDFSGIFKHLCTLKRVSSDSGGYVVLTKIYPCAMNLTFLANQGQHMHFGQTKYTSS